MAPFYRDPDSKIFSLQLPFRAPVKQSGGGNEEYDPLADAGPGSAPPAGPPPTNGPPANGLPPAPPMRPPPFTPQVRHTGFFAEANKKEGGMTVGRGYKRRETIGRKG